MNDSKGLARDIQNTVTKKKSRPQSSHSSNNARNSKGFQEFTERTIITTTTKVVTKQRPFSSSGQPMDQLIKGGGNQGDSDSGEHSAEESDRTFSLEEKEEQQKTNQFENLDDESDDENPVSQLRVYDARFKIPATTSIGAMMSSKKKAQSKAYLRLVRNLERFKKLSSSIIVVMMGLACALTLAIYGY